MAPTQGTLTSWKPDKGFGFIRPLGGGVDVFVYIRDFGRIPRPPMVGDSVTFQPMKGKDGRYRAADVRIAGVARAQMRAVLGQQLSDHPAPLSAVLPRHPALAPEGPISRRGR